ncbi:MAG: ribokinase [Stappia sp.]|uniref:ribokinase n=1 Tax=Stappia sp. TaxID=1870903 RepID=UPI000C372AFB|nr:ribokinase [Stappia sp.]MAB00263.1 ribokinase [Stappia sp.]MBM21012.1 ribokinase [Stappia sp.]
MITVFGSINLDLVVCLPRLPVPGETVVGPDHQTFAGGKGANQALAAARAGASVRMVGAVGRDAHSAPALANLDLAGVDLSAVRHLEGTTGLAMIGIDAEGENLIMCASGVNARVAADWLDGVLEPDDLLVLQRELSADPISGAIARARKVGARVLLNAAPSGDAALAGLIGDVDVLVANAVEAAELAGAFGCPGAEGAEVHCAALCGNSRLAVVTLGGDGLVARTAERIWRVAAPRIEVLDTTGAGDAFVGALAAALDRGADISRALAEGTAAGALACTATGAQSSSPDAGAIAELADTLVVETAPVTR